MTIEWSPLDDYQIIQKIGRGRYSDVFQGINVKNNKFCAIKILKPVRKSKINREIKVLQNVSGGPNIVKLLDVCKDFSSETPSLIFEYLQNTDYHFLFKNFGDMEIRNYLFQLLKALDHTHKNGIVHRDVKPVNVIYEARTSEMRLVDWGLADFYFPGKEFNVRVSTRFFKAPELLMQYRHYHYSLDMWSLGCMMAGMKEPFFKGIDDDDQFSKIMRKFSQTELSQYIRRYDITPSKQIEQVLTRSTPTDWSRYVNKNNSRLVSTEALNLLKKMLVLDHSDRLFAHEAIEHPYFDPVRNHVARILD
ncbi:hypothetical protein MHBO_000766 [Bonamia ostreae]|uniref:non-specific serine/threonine protein kinase n=1 Tax=Bonamia ostreae TaxID=126728 RepID=A0ABV2AGS3_9EUKA